MTSNKSLYVVNGCARNMSHFLQISDQPVASRGKSHALSLIPPVCTSILHTISIVCHSKDVSDPLDGNFNFFAGMSFKRADNCSGNDTKLADSDSTEAKTPNALSRRTTARFIRDIYPSWSSLNTSAGVMFRHTLPSSTHHNVYEQVSKGCVSVTMSRTIPKISALQKAH